MEITVPADFQFFEHVYIVPVYHPLDIRVYQKQFHEMSREEKQMEYTCAALGLGSTSVSCPTLHTKRVCDLRVLASNDEERGFVQAILVPNKNTLATRERIIYQQAYNLNSYMINHSDVQDRLIQDHVGLFFS